MSGPMLFSRQVEEDSRISLKDMNSPNAKRDKRSAPYSPSSMQQSGQRSPLKKEVAGIIAQTDASGQQYRSPDTADSPLVDGGQESADMEDKSCWDLFFPCCSCSYSCFPATDKNQSQSPSSISKSGSLEYDDGRSSSIGLTSSPYARRPAHWPKPQRMPNIGPIARADKGKKCLVLDLDETLVHSSTDFMPNADYKIPVEIDGMVHNIYVLKRPGVDEFLMRMKPYYEVIVFTASLAKYANPLLDLLDVNGVVTSRLFREHCVFYQGHFVKDLSVIDRTPQSCILVDNSPMSYSFQPDSAIDCSSFIDDPKDDELWRIADFLEGIHRCADVRTLCRHWREWLVQHPKT